MIGLGKQTRDARAVHRCIRCNTDYSDLVTCRCGACASLRDSHRPSRNERLQALADAGCDTWEEHRGER